MRCTLRAMRYLRRSVIVSVSVPGNLAFPAHVVVADSLPPDGGLRGLQLGDLREHAVLALGVQQVDPDRRVVTLHQVDQVEHSHKGDLRKASR